MTIHSDIDKIFRDGLSGHSQRPPGFVWDNIEYELNKNRFKKRRNILYAVAASVVILISFGTGFLFHKNSENRNFMVKTELPAPVLNVDNNNQRFADAADKVPSRMTLESSLKTLDTKQPQKELTAKENKELTAKENNKKNKKTSKQQQREVNIKTKNKVKSEGTLLPPMFAEQNNYESAEENTVVLTGKSENLALIEKQKFDLALALEERDLKYELRELPMYSSYDETVLSNDYSKWSVGVNATPLVSYREVNGVDKSVLTEADILSNYEQQYQNEKPLVSYSAGVDVNYNITKRLKVQSGLYYSEIGQISQDVNINQSPIYYNADGEQYYSVNTSVGNVSVKGSQNQLVNQFTDTKTPPGVEVPGRETVDNSSLEPDLQTNFVQSFEYYEIPMVLNYKVIDRKLGLNMAGGISANILYQNKTFVEENGDRYILDGQSENINDVGYNGIIGLAFDYPILSKLYFNFQPTFKYGLSSISKENQVHPYSFGVYTGLRYNF